MNARRARVAASLALALAAARPLLGADQLALADLPALVLTGAPPAIVADQSVIAAYHAYRGALADAMPQLDLTTQYLLGYTPAMTMNDGNVEVTDYASHAAVARLALSQILPTAGSLLVSVEDTLAVTTIGSSTVGAATTYPDPDVRQSPKASVSLSQPVLLNGKLIDLALFPASLRKAQLGLEKEQASRRATANEALLQAVRLYCSVVELRNGVARLERTVQLAERRLATMEESYRLGSAAEADLLETRIASGQQRQSLLDLRSGLARTERLLAASLGLPGVGATELAASVPSWTREGDPADLQEAVLRQHPVVAQRALAAEERRLDEQIAGQRYASTLTLSFSVAPRRSSEAAERTLGQSFSDLFAEGAGVDWSVSAGLALRLFDAGRQREDRAAAQALTAAAQQGLASQRQAVLDDLAAALERRSILEERVGLLVEAADLARRRLAVEESLLGQGRSTDLDVEARRLDVEAKESDLWRARADLLLANFDIASLAGDDLAAIVGGLGR